MYQRWPKRDPNKHYYLVPNEVFNLGLSSHEIAVYNYLLRCEDRKTYQCHPSYRTIGRAVQLSENTVRKYVAGLEEKGLIRTEPSTVTTKDGRVRNGSLIYTIRPIREAIPTSPTICSAQPPPISIAASAKQRRRRTLRGRGRKLPRPRRKSRV